MGTVYRCIGLLVCEQLGVRHYLVGGKTAMFHRCAKTIRYRLRFSVIVPKIAELEALKGATMLTYTKPHKVTMRGNHMDIHTNSLMQPKTVTSP